jgi:hypothetical protein
MNRRIEWLLMLRDRCYDRLHRIKEDYELYPEDPPIFNLDQTKKDMARIKCKLNQERQKWLP